MASRYTPARRPAQTCALSHTVKWMATTILIRNKNRIRHLLFGTVTRAARPLIFAAEQAQWQRHTHTHTEWIGSVHTDGWRRWNNYFQWSVWPKGVFRRYSPRASILLHIVIQHNHSFLIEICDVVSVRFGCVVSARSAKIRPPVCIYNSMYVRLALCDVRIYFACLQLGHISLIT